MPYRAGISRRHKVPRVIVTVPRTFPAHGVGEDGKAELPGAFRGRIFRSHDRQLDWPVTCRLMRHKR
jgi:hypothetical protein